MRTTAYLAGLATFAVAMAFHASPASAMVDCNRCEAQYQACIHQGHDDAYCLDHTPAACIQWCPLVSVNKHTELLDPKSTSVAMNPGRPSVSLLEPKAP